MSTIKITDAANEPITLAELKLWARIDQAIEDTFIEGITIPAARQEAERRMRRSIISTTWAQFRDSFPSERAIVLEYPNLISVSHVKYYDTAGVLQTWANTNYAIDTASQPGRVLLLPDIDWPDTQADRFNAVEIQYVSGWANANAVPKKIKQWIALFAATLVAHREVIAMGTSVSDIAFSNSLLDEFCIWGY